MSENLKLVVVGDGAVGKTSLLMAYLNGTFSNAYTPTVFENFTATIKTRNTEHKLLLCDTAGQEEYSRLRPLAYPKTNVFLLCCSVVLPDSFDNTRTTWLPELAHHCPSVPFILVGTKIDLREDIQYVKKMQQRPVSREEGEKQARKMGAIKYIECSAKTQYNVKELFEEALIVALKGPIKIAKKKQCVLL